MMNTVVLVEVLKKIQKFSLRQSKQEFVVPIKYAGLFDMIDQRKRTNLDVILLFAYGVCMFALPFVWSFLLQLIPTN